MRHVERARTVDANYRSCLAFLRVLHAGLCTFNAHAHRRFNMSRNAGMVKRWPTALLPTSTTRRRRANSSGGFPENPPYRGGQRPATDVAVKLNHVLPTQADASRGNEGASSRADVGAWSRRQP